MGGFVFITRTSILLLIISSGHKTTILIQQTLDSTESQTLVTDDMFLYLFCYHML